MNSSGKPSGRCIGYFKRLKKLRRRYYKAWDQAEVDNNLYDLVRRIESQRPTPALRSLLSATKDLIEVRSLDEDR